MVEEKPDQELDLESRARKVMGESFNLDKFGDKSLKMINEDDEPVVLSEDEDQPNSKKNITHKNIKMPEGYCPFKRAK